MIENKEIETMLNELCVENLKKVKNILEKDLKTINKKIKQIEKRGKKNEKKNIR